MKLEPIAIPIQTFGETGTLAALRYIPARQMRDTTLIYAHGFTSGKYSMDGLASYLAMKGWPGVTFDSVGHKLGASGGEMWRTEQAAENLRDVLKWTRQNTDTRRIVLIGHSMGAAASLAVAAQEQQNSDERCPIVGVASLCMGTEPARSFEGAVGQAMLGQRADYVTGAPARELLDGLDRLIASVPLLNPAANSGTDNHAQLPRYPLPSTLYPRLLFVAARQDVLISVARVEALAALTGPIATVSVIESSHLDAPDRTRSVLASWLETALGDQ